MVEERQIQPNILFGPPLGRNESEMWVGVGEIMSRDITRAEMDISDCGNSLTKLAHYIKANEAQISPQESQQVLSFLLSVYVSRLISLNLEREMKKSLGWSDDAEKWFAGGWRCLTK